MVVAGQVQQTVKDEEFDFDGERVAPLGSLPERGIDADREVAFFFNLGKIGGGKRKDVRWLVFAAEAPVQVAHGCVAGEQHGDMAAEADCGLSF